MTVRTLTVPQFHAELAAQGVSHERHYALTCPACSTVQSLASLVAAGATPTEAERLLGTSCEGRISGAGPAQEGRHSHKRGCDWTLSGMFRIHKLEVETPDGDMHPRFEIASAQEAQDLESEITPLLDAIGVIDPNESRRLNGVEALRRLDKQITNLAIAAGPISNDEEWEKLFDMIFGPIQTEARELLEANNLTFPDYYDPDTTYGEDAMAWINAFREVVVPFLNANPPLEQAA